MTIFLLDEGVLAVASCDAPARHRQRVAVDQIVDRLAVTRILPAGSRIARSVSGRPYLSLAPHLHVSITHSGPWAALAVSGRPVGIDIETRSTVPPAVLQLFASATELGILPAVRIWSIKEAALKCAGAVGEVRMREIEVGPRVVLVPGYPRLHWSAWRRLPGPEVIVVVPDESGG